MKLLLICACLLAAGLGGALAVEDAPAATPIPGYLKTDEEIKSVIIKGVVANPNVFAASLEVEVERGAVTLRGMVKNREAKKAAEKIARSAPGVRKVKNELKVQRRNSR